MTVAAIRRKIVRRQPPRANVEQLSTGLHPVLARVYAARSVRSPEELDRSLSRLYHPQLLKGMDAAVALLGRAVEQDQRIVLVADFDADGATGCALALRALRAMGAQQVAYVVPDRFRYGYGLTPEIVALAAEQHPRVLVTIDNGIASLQGGEAARERGMELLITDHHLPGERLPAAAAIVNPNQPGDEFPSKHLAGVGVIFYVMMALRAHLRARGWFARRAVTVPRLAPLLDLVALGTIADLVPLDYNNRILVRQGLARINRGEACAGIQALLRVAGRHAGDSTTSDLGFYVAPRLNAAGRLEDMSLGIECLLTDDAAVAGAAAERLDELNRERRSIEATMQAQALAAVEAVSLKENALPPALCLFDAGWHQGIVGLVAARIKDRYERPTIAFAPGGDDELKGSARSIVGLHMRDVLDAIASRYPGLLRRFGGHAMAAGLSLAPEKLEEFRLAFSEEVRARLPEEALAGKILSDGELGAADLTLELAAMLRAAGPWGQGFPEPVFDGRFDVVGTRVVGERHLRLSLRCPGAEKVIEAIAFGHAANGANPDWRRAHAAYRLDINEYQGYRSLQLLIEQIESCED